MHFLQRDPYVNPRQALAERKDEYLATVIAADDEAGPTKHRGYLRRSASGPNPKPLKLTPETKTRLTDG